MSYLLTSHSIGADILKEHQHTNKETTISKPHSALGSQVHDLVRRCQPLDVNSVYCNILQCDHFAETSCAAISADNQLVGFVSGYLPPKEKGKTLFIWQVAVDGSQRGKGLGVKMIQDILARDNCQNVQFVETTVTESNMASTAMFEKLAKLFSNKAIVKHIHYASDTHFNGEHDSELLFRIACQ